MHIPRVVPTSKSWADAGPLLSNKQHTEQIKESRCCESHPFLTLHITETHSACSRKQQGVFGGEKDLHPGERLFGCTGVKQREGGSQKSLMIKKKEKKISFSNDNQRSNHSKEPWKLLLFWGKHPVKVGKGNQSEAGRSKSRR